MTTHIVFILREKKGHSEGKYCDERLKMQNEKLDLKIHTHTFRQGIYTQKVKCIHLK